MKQYLFISSLILLFFSSCGAPTTQYDLIIKNTTSKPIHVFFKSHNPNDIKSEKIIIPANKQRKIISTVDIPNDKIKQPTNPCKMIAKSLEISLEDGQISNYKWCSSTDVTDEADFKLTQVDFEQQEYIVTIKDTHFD
jgi:hypothetical protein